MAFWGGFNRVESFHIDLPTLIILNGALGIVASIMLTTNWAMNRDVKGTKEWSIALWCWAFSMLLLLARGSWPPFITVVCANGLVVIGSFYMLLGISKYHEKNNFPRWLEAIVTVLMMIGFYYYSMVDIDVQKRVLLLTSFSAIIKFAALYFLIPTIKKFTGVGTLMAIGFIVHGLFFSYHSYLGAFGPEEYAAVQLQQTTIYLLIEVFLFMLWFTVSATMLTNVYLQRGLKRLAYRDTLTGLLNRRSLFESCEQIINNQKILKFSLLMIDLDKFKNINDTYGHAVGDKILIHFVSIASKELGVTDVFGRIGGEEFVIVIPNTNHDESQSIANRICTSIRNSFISHNNEKISYTVSIGIVSISNNSNVNLSEIIHNADKAMYQAKQKGRDRIEVFKKKPKMKNIDSPDITLNKINN